MSSILTTPAPPDFDDAVHIPAYVRDLHSFLDWAHSDEFPERGRISYIKGEIIIDMSAQEIDSHANLKIALYGEFWEIVKTDKSGDLFPDPTLFVNEEADVSNEPDLMFVSFDSVREGRVEYRERIAGSERIMEVVGSPDLVVEIVSDSSVRKDTKKLFTGYYDAGVREYWLIDARGAEIDFQLLTRGTSSFQRIAPDRDGFAGSAVFNRAFRLSRERNPVGLYRYELKSRSQTTTE